MHQPARDGNHRRSGELAVDPTGIQTYRRVDIWTLSWAHRPPTPHLELLTTVEF
jgi:hypothetical protein